MTVITTFNKKSKNQGMDFLTGKNIKAQIGPKNAHAKTKPESNTPPMLH